MTTRKAIFIVLQRSINKKISLLLVLLKLIFYAIFGGNEFKDNYIKLRGITKWDRHLDDILFNLGMLRLTIGFFISITLYFLIRPGLEIQTTSFYIWMHTSTIRTHATFTIFTLLSFIPPIITFIGMIVKCIPSASKALVEMLWKSMQNNIESIKKEVDTIVDENRETLVRPSTAPLLLPIEDPTVTMKEIDNVL